MRRKQETIAYELGEKYSKFVATLYSDAGNDEYEGANIFADGRVLK